MDDYWAEFLKVAAAHLLAVASPGPDFAVVMRQSLGYGRRVGLWTSVGVGCGILLHVAYSLCGIALVIKGSEFWFTLLKYVAAAYIAWIGLQSILAKPKLLNEERIEMALAPTTAAAFRTGFLTNALNPKATLFFLALFATVISPSTPTLVKLGYGGWMTLATMVWFCLVATVFTAAEVRLKFIRYGHWLDRALGFILLGFAVSLALTR
jgi:RhtB (resistance to homoserine/threonine) family protein